MKRIVFLIFVFIIFTFLIPSLNAQEKKKVKAKFYDFSDQLIDGDIKKPKALYTDARQKAKFDRLLRLRKSFIREMIKTSKDSVFK